MAIECQYNLLDEKVKTKEKVESLASKDILLVKRQLKRRNSSERAKLLNGVYKQLILSRTGKIARGFFLFPTVPFPFHNLDLHNLF